MTTVYYLLHKRYEKLGQMPSHFNIQDGTSPKSGTPRANKFDEEADQKREEDLSCSPVKKGRRRFLQDQRDEDEIKDVIKPKLSWRDDDSGTERKKTRAERIEATGSVSPDKKKRRVKPADGEGFQVVRMQSIEEESPVAMPKLQLNLATAEKPSIGDFKDSDQPLPRKSSRGAAEYKKKIEAYKKDSYKYKNRNEGCSADEKLKTKALLKNIEKFLNRGKPT